MGPASRRRTVDPELLTVQLAGLDITSAYDVRVTVEDGNLVVREGGAETFRFPAARLSGAVWFTPEETRDLLGRRRAGLVARSDGLVVLLEDSSPVVGLLVARFCPSAGSDQDRRETSGMEALARALDVVVESSQDHPEVRRDRMRGLKVLPTPERSPLVPAGAWLITLATGALAFWGCRLAPDYVTAEQALVRVTASLVLGAVLVAWMLRQHLCFRRAVSMPPEVGPGASTYAARPDVEERPEVARLVLAPDRVTAWNGVVLRRVMGPAAGGVRSCVVGADVVAFTDAAARVLLQLDTSQMCPDEPSRTRLAAACQEAGIRFEEMPVELMTGRMSTTWRFTRAFRPHLAMGSDEGDEIAPHLRFPGGLMAFLLLLVAGLAAWATEVPAGAALLAASVVESALFFGIWTAFRRWENRVIKANA